MDCRSFIALLLVLSGCSAARDADRFDAAPAGGSAPPWGPLAAGTWRGDVTPSNGGPFGAFFHVAASDTGPSIWLESQYYRLQFTDVGVHDDTLRFTWPGDSPRACTLIRSADGSFAGRCQGPGARAVPLTLLPPGSDDAPIGLARYALESGISWVEEREGQLRILIQSGTPLTGERARLRRSAATAFRDAFALLETAPPRGPFWLFYVDSRSTMGRLVGWPAGGWADGVARTAANTVNADGRSPDRHEIMHVAATVVWGIPVEPWQWINEGLATYAQGECAGYAVHPLASSLIARGEAVPLARLFYDFRDVDEVTAYLQGASLVGYIHETFGIDAVRAVWQQGVDAIPRVLGVTVDGLEEAWHLHAADFDGVHVDWETIRSAGCY